MPSITTEYEIGEGLKIEDGKLCVDVIDQAVQNENRPITSNAAAVEIGNLDALLNTV